MSRFKEPKGELKFKKLVDFSENKAAIYFTVLFEDEDGNEWEAQNFSRFKYDLVKKQVIK